MTPTRGDGVSRRLLSDLLRFSLFLFELAVPVPRLVAGHVCCRGVLMSAPSGATSSFRTARDMTSVAISRDWEVRCASNEKAHPRL
jgi:hypothetical protein